VGDFDPFYKSAYLSRGTIVERWWGLEMVGDSLKWCYLVCGWEVAALRVRDEREIKRWSGTSRRTFVFWLRAWPPEFSFGMEITG